jgi:hypothetical protein
MNWDAIGAMGEIVGAVAVVVSLIYLASQIRQQNRESRISSAHEITEAFRDTIGAMKDPARAELSVKAMRGLEGLTDAEKIQVLALAQTYFRVWEEAHYQHTEKRLEASMWEAMCVQFGGLMSIPMFAESWNLRKSAYRKEFQHFVDNERDTSIANPIGDLLGIE